MKSRMPNHSSGKFCNCDREGRCCRNTWGGGGGGGGGEEVTLAY